jgi:quercetin dioxygenase-like cupin family protein
MGKVTFNANYLPRKDTNTGNPALLLFDLPTLVDKMKHKQSWANGELSAMILLKTPNKQIVLTAMHDGTEIQSFQSDDSITFQIIEGQLMLHTRKESVTLVKGQLLTLHENIKYSLNTREETVLLLTIASGVLNFSEN